MLVVLTTVGGGVEIMEGKERFCYDCTNWAGKKLKTKRTIGRCLLRHMDTYSDNHCNPYI